MMDLILGLGIVSVIITAVGILLVIYVERFLWTSERKETQTQYEYRTGNETTRHIYVVRFNRRLPWPKRLSHTPEIDTFDFTDATFAVSQLSGPGGHLIEGEDFFVEKKQFTTELRISKRFFAGSTSSEFVVEITRYKSRFVIDTLMEPKREGEVREDGTTRTSMSVENHMEATIVGYEFVFSVPSLDDLGPALIRRSGKQGTQDFTANPMDFLVRLDVPFSRLPTEKSKAIEQIKGYQVIAYEDVPPGKTTVAIRYKTPIDKG
jgi:hypothetical protein